MLDYDVNCLVEDDSDDYDYDDFDYDYLERDSDFSSISNKFIQPGDAYYGDFI